MCHAGLCVLVYVDTRVCVRVCAGTPCSLLWQGMVRRCTWKWGAAELLAPVWCSACMLHPSLLAAPPVCKVDGAVVVNEKRLKEGSAHPPVQPQLLGGKGGYVLSAPADVEEVGRGFACAAALGRE